jgi:hypothetical protein
MPEPHMMAQIVWNPYRAFAPIPILLVTVALIAVAVGVFWLMVLAGWEPVRILPSLAWLRKSPREDVCGKCGYDLRASPERCPECGTPRPKPKVPSKQVGQLSRVLWSIRFEVGEDVLDVAVWRDLIPIIEVLQRDRPGDAELLFAASGANGDAVTLSPNLRKAAESMLEAIQARAQELPGSDALTTAARRVRQFARQHPYDRVARTVNRRSA